MGGGGAKAGWGGRVVGVGCVVKVEGGGGGGSGGGGGVVVGIGGQGRGRRQQVAVSPVWVQEYIVLTAVSLGKIQNTPLKLRARLSIWLLTTKNNVYKKDLPVSDLRYDRPIGVVINYYAVSEMNNPGLA